MIERRSLIRKIYFVLLGLAFTITIGQALYLTGGIVGIMSVLVIALGLMFLVAAQPDQT